MSKVTITFRTRDQKTSAVVLDKAEFDEMQVEQFLQAVAKRFEEVFKEEMEPAFLLTQMNAALANTDKISDYVLNGQQCTVLQKGEPHVANPNAVKGGKSFKVLKKPIGNTGEYEERIQLVDQNLCSYVGQLLPREENIYQVGGAEIEIEKFLPVLPRMKLMAANQNMGRYILPLYDYLESKFADTTSKIEALTKDGKITYSTLWFIFPVDAAVFGVVNGFDVGMTVTKYQYFGGMFPGLQLTGKVIKSDGSQLLTTEQNFFIPRFAGAVPLASLSVQVINEQMMEKLVARGKLFEKIAIGNHFMRYSGHMLFETWMSVTKFRADGRIMVDGVSFNQMNPSYKVYKDSQNHRQRGGGEFGAQVTEIPAESLFMTWPTIGGFSFATKKWGEVVVECCSELVFDRTAFTRLVLPEEQKKLMLALVENQSKTINDVIEGKGGGVIFLLHGPPGVGKTLSAESISEYLERPLYSISVGELGVDCASLEKALSEVLEVATRWNAVILLDEADIFLEKRTMNDIQRNALVGIFLRLLEYHTGVLFLTSNRVKSFDPAFHSRISIALRYPNLTEESRKAIWVQLLGFAGLEKAPLNVNELASYDLNGRQIRTTIKLACSLALQDGEQQEVTMRHFEACVHVANKFKNDLAASGVWVNEVDGDLELHKQHNADEAPAKKAKTVN